MAALKKYQRYEHYLLRGKLRHNGYEKWRYSFVGVNNQTGEERAFFIELYLVNPALSPKEPVISQKFKLSMSNSDLQYALAGTDSASSAAQEVIMQPSYVLVKAGIFGERGKQFNRFLPSSQLQWNKSETEFRVGDCVFASDHLAGFVRITPRDLHDFPEFLCNAGSMDWKLHFEKNIGSAPLYKKKGSLWIPSGAKTSFAGVVHVDGSEYTVSPRKSSGYLDRQWGSLLRSPAFHISSSNLTSIISGRALPDSCFTISGEFENEIKLFVCLEGDVLEVKASTFDKLTEVHECSEMPPDADGEKLHWTVSIHKKKLVVDIDVFCKTSEMFVREYEAPEGNRRILKLLGGGTGFGEIRIYKKLRKDLELLEHAHVADALCEYGRIEEVGK